MSVSPFSHSLQQSRPGAQRGFAFLKVFVPVVDTLDTLELVVKTALGYVRVYTDGSQVGAGGAAEIANGEGLQPVFYLGKRNADFDNRTL